jgi:hypothetical protein
MWYVTGTTYKCRFEIFLKSLEIYISVKKRQLFLYHSIRVQICIYTEDLDLGDLINADPCRGSGSSTLKYGNKKIRYKLFAKVSYRYRTRTKINHKHA